MKEVKEMIESAPTVRDARYMLNMWYSFGKISKAQFEKGQTLIRKEFKQRY